MISCKQALQANEYRCGSININTYILMVLSPVCLVASPLHLSESLGTVLLLLTNQPSLLGLAKKSLVLHVPIVPLLIKRNPFSTIFAINPL